MHLQRDQLRRRGVLKEGESDPAQVYQQSGGGQRDRRDPAGLPPEGKEGRWRRIRPVLPDLGRELPRGLHLLFLQLEQAALRQRRQASHSGVLHGPPDRPETPHGKGDGQGRPDRGASLLAWPVLRHAAHPLVPEPELQYDLRRPPDRPGGPSAAGAFPERTQAQRHGAAGRYDRYAPRLHQPPSHEGILLDLPP